MTATTLRIPFAHGAQAGPLRSNARAVLSPWYASDHVEDVLLVISELVQNVTQHTGGGGVLVLNWDSGSITIEVRDEDPRIPHQQRPDEHRLGGRGLLLVAGICSSWGSIPNDHGKTVWARLDVPAAENVSVPPGIDNCG